MFNNRGRYDNSPYNQYSTNNSYGYGYSNYNSSRGTWFGGRRNYDNNYNGYGSYNSYGGYGDYGGYSSYNNSLFGRGRSLFGQRQGLFGRRSYGPYSGRRGLFSRIFGGVGLGIVAIGSLISGVTAIHRWNKEKQTEKGKRSYGTMDLTLLWAQRPASVVLKIPIILSLYYLPENEEQIESRFTVKVGKTSKISTNSQQVLNDLYALVQDSANYCMNFNIEGGNDRNKLTIVQKDGYDEKDEWLKLQTICNTLSEYFVTVEDLLDDMSIRHEPLEFSRLVSTTLAAVLEQAGFMSARTVDCKQDYDDEVYSWCVTDVSLRHKNKPPVVVRVDLLHYVFDEDSEDSGISYSFAVNGRDPFDGRELVTGSGAFTGWDSVDSHLKETMKGLFPTTQTKGNSRRKIPIVTSAINKYRNNRRIGVRKERRKGAFAAEPNTDVIFRNLLWYDTKSKPGKIMIKVLPFTLLVTYQEIEGIPDKDTSPTTIGYNFLPVETEYVCGETDLELYIEEITQGISFPINFSITLKNDKYVLHQKKINSITDSWERLQKLAKYSVSIVENITSDFGDWIREMKEYSLSAFESAILAAVLKLAGFIYARPINVENDWSVVDVSLTRPKTKRSLVPRRYSYVFSGLQQRTETFNEFLDNKTHPIVQACTNSVVVRVDIHSKPITYGYSEEASVNTDSSPIVSDLRGGCEPFLGWHEDVDYQLRRHSSIKAVRKQRKNNNTAQSVTIEKTSTQKHLVDPTALNITEGSSDQMKQPCIINNKKGTDSDGIATGDIQKLDL